jgi:hypothetical protein
MKKLLLSAALGGFLLLGSLPASFAAVDPMPKSVIHVVTVKWKEGTTPEQIKAALDGVQALTKSFPGITRVWTRSIKVQGGAANAFVMEFADEAALKAYGGSDAQKEWYKAYLPIRERSTTFDITN